MKPWLVLLLCLPPAAMASDGASGLTFLMLDYPSNAWVPPALVHVGPSVSASDPVCFLHQHRIWVPTLSAAPDTEVKLVIEFEANVPPPPLPGPEPAPFPVRPHVRYVSHVDDLAQGPAVRTVFLPDHFPLVTFRTDEQGRWNAPDGSGWPLLPAESPYLHITPWQDPWKQDAAFLVENTIPEATVMLVHIAARAGDGPEAVATWPAYIDQVGLFFTPRCIP